jgi:parallel beta-helix repeat protein
MWNMIRGGLLVSVFGLVTPLLGAGPAQPQSTPVTTCGQVLSTAGQYHLAGDLGPCSGDGVVITASGVHLTLAGHTISGMSTTNSCNLQQPQLGVNVNGVNGPVSDVLVNGGTVTGFVDGIDLNFASTSRVNAMTLMANCVFGMAIGNSDGIEVDTNVVTSSGLDGVGIGNSHDVVVHSNDISGNARAGVDISDFANKNTIQSNILNDNGPNNGGFGVAIFNGNNNTIRDNAANHNHSGILLSGNTGNVAVGNTANGNSSTGISIAAGGTSNVVRKNIARGNGAVDLADGNAGCDSNKWKNNTIASDPVAGVPDGGPGTGCIR